MKSIVGKWFSSAFEEAVRDVKHLLELHDSETGRRRGRPSPYVEVLKRAGVVLAVTAWETFIEDALKSAVEQRLAQAESPVALRGTFNAVASAWLSKGDVRAPDLAQWTQEGWKKVITRRFNQEIEKLNTPDSMRIAEITKRYLGYDLTESWHWQSCGHQLACKRLDKLIRLRGELVHRARDFIELKAVVKRADLVSSIDLFKHLVQATEKRLGFERREV